MYWKLFLYIVIEGLYVNFKAYSFFFLGVVMKKVMRTNNFISVILYPITH